MKYLFSSICSRASSSRNEDGSSLVEFATSVTLLVVLVCGLMVACLALYVNLLVDDAAREATRYAIVRGSTLSTDCTAPGYATCIAQPADIQSYVFGLPIGGLNQSNLTVASTWLTSAGAICGTDDSCKPPGNIVQVTVTYAYPLSLPFIPASTVNLTSRSQMVIAQ